MEVSVAKQEINEHHKKSLGQVKWFNNKSGYGFITVLGEGEMRGKDIFSHHSALQAKGDLYKYLVQGEYVEFDVQKFEGKEHEHQAVNITGVRGGDLMCETRHKNRDLSKSKDSFTKVRRGRRDTQH